MLFCFCFSLDIYILVSNTLRVLTNYILFFLLIKKFSLSFSLYLLSLLPLGASFFIFLLFSFIGLYNFSSWTNRILILIVHILIIIYFVQLKYLFICYTFKLYIIIINTYNGQTKILVRK